MSSQSSSGSAFNMYRIAFAVCLLGIVAAKLEFQPYEGKCVYLEPEANFEIEKYSGDGVWYVVYFNDHAKFDSENKKCPQVRYYYDFESKELTLEKYSLNKYYRPVWSNTTKEMYQPGKFRFPSSIADKESDWWYKVDSVVVKTNYNYSVVYSCYDIEGENKYYAFVKVLYREREFPEYYYDEIKNFFKSKDMQFSFNKQDYSDCRARCENN